VFRYVVPSHRVVKGYGDLPRMWIPSAILEIPQCRAGEMFLVDCCLSTKIRNPFLRILLIKKMPKKFELSLSPPIEAPRLEPGMCTEFDIVNDFNTVYSNLSRGELGDLDKIVEYFTKPKDLKIKVVTIPLLGIRRKTYVIPARRIFETSRRIAMSSVEEVTRRLCVGSPRMYPVRVTQAYVLGVVDPFKKSVDLVIGKKVISSSSHFTAMFSIPELEDMVSRVIQSGTGREE